MIKEGIVVHQGKLTALPTTGHQNFRARCVPDQAANRED
jgi:hypothetical protein